MPAAVSRGQPDSDMKQALHEEIKKLRQQLAAKDDKYQEMRKETLRRGTFTQQQVKLNKHNKQHHKKAEEIDQTGSLLAIAQKKDRAMFKKFGPNAEGVITSERLVNALKSHGLIQSDIRLAECFAELKLKTELNFEDFQEIKNNNLLMDRALNNQLAIPNFAKFREGVKQCYKSTKDNEGGGVATYIPSLARINPDQYGVAVCTVDGQRCAIGDSKFPFCIQSSSKPLTYGMALELHGVDKVHQHVGREPSGRGFNSRVMLEQAEGGGVDAHGNPTVKGIPHNPCINAGAIMCSSLVKAEETEDGRFDWVIAKWEKLAGGHRVGFQNGTYMGERSTADRNFCLGYMMKEENAFPDSLKDNADLLKTLESYFMYCSIELTAESMAVVAGSLANGGVCPITGERVFEPWIVKHILSIMQSCGMYDGSGDFAFTVGFPTKSGVSGVLCIVIPGVVGISTFSPRLDSLGNSVRGVAFCHELNKRYPFHQFATLNGCSEEAANGNQEDITKSAEDHHTEDDDITHMWFAAAAGDVIRLQQLAARGIDITIADYDRRSPLHLATSNGHLDAVRFLVSIGADIEYTDTFGNKAIDDAIREGHKEIEAELLLEQTHAKKRALPMSKAELVSALEAQGINCDDSGGHSGMGPVMEELAKVTSEKVDVTSKEFLAQEVGTRTISKTMAGNLVIPNFPLFKDKMQKVFDRTSTATDIRGLGSGDGKGMSDAMYDHLDHTVQALGICTVDGQRASFDNGAGGAEKTRFCIDELIRPVLYIQGMNQLGLEGYHKHVGREPAPSDATQVELDPHDMPFNPMTTSGAILSTALVDGAMPAREKMKRMQKLLTRLQGGEEVTENTSQFDKLSDNCNKQACVSYMMKASGCMDATTSVTENLHAYFRCCTLESNVQGLAVLAATLANGGVCPTTGERVFQANEVKDCLSVMYASGMDTVSGTFQFEVGVPARSGSTGATMIIVPNVLGACYFNTPLNPHTGIGFRSMRFCKELVSTFAFHQHDRTSLHKEAGLEDPTMYSGNEDHLLIAQLLTAASVGDLMAIKNLHSLGVDLNSADYDLRTAVHLAAVSGDVPTLRYFAEQGANLEPRDRWGGKPIDDARKQGHKHAVKALEKYLGGGSGDGHDAGDMNVPMSPMMSPRVEPED